MAASAVGYKPNLVGGGSYIIPDISPRSIVAQVAPLLQASNSQSLYAGLRSVIGTAHAAVWAPTRLSNKPYMGRLLRNRTEQISPRGHRQGPSEGQLSGVVEEDGTYFGGYVKKDTVKANIDRRYEILAKRPSGVVARERDGKTLPFVIAKKVDAVVLIGERIAMGGIVHADEAGGWDRLQAYYDVKRINHSVAFSKDGACTNQAGKLLLSPAPCRARPARAHQRQIPAGLCRRGSLTQGWTAMPNGALHQAATAEALGHPVSRVWKGYWQRASAT